MITVEVVRQVIDAWQTTVPPSSAGHRACHGTRCSTTGRCLRASQRSLEQGAKAWSGARGRILNVAVTDPGCLRDVDTPDDYKSLS
jgi:CTP:molybdopterin cytidylyltransferase MocA